MPTTERLSIRKIHYLLMSLLLLASLASCGFQLRESVAIPADFGPVKIQGISEFSTIYKAVRNALRQSSIEITQDDSANHILIINRVRNERRVLSVDSSGKVAENELIKSITFQLLDRDGNSVTEPQTISTNRSYAVPETAGLGTALEDQEISQSMEESLVARMLRYLAGRI